MSMETSAVEYLASKEELSLPTAFEDLAAQVKRDIQSGCFGAMLKFKPKKRDYGSRFDVEKRTAIVALVNNHRGKGLTAREACTKIDVPYSSYSHWAGVLNMTFVK